MKREDEDELVHVPSFTGSSSSLMRQSRHSSVDSIQLLPIDLNLNLFMCDVLLMQHSHDVVELAFTRHQVD